MNEFEQSAKQYYFHAAISYTGLHREPVYAPFSYQLLLFLLLKGTHFYQQDKAERMPCHSVPHLVLQ